MADGFRLPDQIYIDHLRDALWGRKTSFASVMVGAGFSLNAKPINATSGTMPTWSDLVGKFVDDLYPADDPEAAWYRDAALRTSAASSGMLRLAEEYAIAFGRDRLDQRLRDFVPDLGFEPSRLHATLLSLPWKDVFTTNWDTLLERAARRLPDRHYEVVATPRDLSRSGSPRIVKLHGSFPHTRPFIVAEEDYRTYPDEFAPFVNVVRQAAMECVLCLVGFSGADPNFLAWTGWVRDQLGPHQPHIFLVGLDAHSQAQRLLFERRGVRLIDLSKLPGLDLHPRRDRHRIALDWFLGNLLEGGSSPDPKEWPGHGGGAKPAPGPHGLPPFPPAPRPNFPGPPPMATGGDEDLAWAIDTALLWRQARVSYPGWLVAPTAVRQRLWPDLNWMAFRVARRIESVRPSIRLLVLRELLWQLQVCLVAPPEPVYELVDATLADVRQAVQAMGRGDVDSPRHASDAIVARTPARPPSDEDEAERRLWTNEDAVGTAWVELAFTLLRRAREHGDEAGFSRWWSPLWEARARDAGLRPRLSYERCLHAIGQVDRRELERAFRAWGADDGGDPYFRVRAAGILVELGRLEEAYRTCEQALDEIRRSRRRDGDDAGAFSREAWALVLLWNVRAAIRFRGQSEGDADDLSSRADEARELRYELPAGIDRPHDILAELKRDLDRPASAQDVTGAGPPAHDGADGMSRRRPALPPSFWSVMRAPLQALRLCDEAGLPALVGNVDLTRTLRHAAVRHLRPVAPSLATVAFLRVGRMKKASADLDLFDSVWVARLDPLEARALARRVGDLLDLALAAYRAARLDASGLAYYWQEKANFAARLLGRLATRLPVDDLRGVVAKAISYFHRGEVDHLWMQESFTGLFDDSIRALPLQDRIEFLIDLTSLAARQGQGPVLAWPAPLVALQPATPAMARAVRGPELDAAIRRLLEVASTPRSNDQERRRGGEPRTDALVRLAILSGLDLLGQEQQRLFAQALWAPIADEGLPANDAVPDDILLILPEPAPGAAELAFRRGYLTADTPDPFADEDVLRSSRAFSIVAGRLASLLRAVTRRDVRGAFLALTNAEAELLSSRLLAFLRRVSAYPRGDEGAFDRDGLVELAQYVLAEAAIPFLDLGSHQTVEAIRACLDAFDRTSEPLLDAEVAFQRLAPASPSTVAERLERDLRSHRPRRVIAALQAVERWLRHGARWGVAEPPGMLATSVALLVEDTWPEVLERALSAAEALVERGLARVPESVSPALLRGLETLRVEADYFRGDLIGSGGLPATDLPTIRVAIGRLVAAMVRSGMGDEPRVRSWVEIIRSDQLDIVRDTVPEVADGPPVPEEAPPAAETAVDGGEAP